MSGKISLSDSYRHFVNFNESLISLNTKRKLHISFKMKNCAIRFVGKKQLFLFFSFFYLFLSKKLIFDIRQLLDGYIYRSVEKL